MISWWREMPAPDKFRHYSRLTLQTSIAAVVIALSTSLGPTWITAGIVISGLAAILAAEARPELAIWPSSGFRRWAPRIGAAVIAGTWVTYVIVAWVSTDASIVADASAAGTIVTGLASLVILPFVRHTWWILLGVSIATGLAFETSLESQTRLAALALLLGGFIVGVTMLTMWSLRIVTDLERSKNVGAELQLAEERLRFSRDLHDVVGRSFSAIAVKSELAATLSRAGAADRATAEINEVKAIAVESMEEMRSLVRGYRDIDLESEVGGARSLLSSMSCDLVVEGDPARVPTQLHEVAAWVVREGTTNIVKHSSATTARLAFGPVGMSLRNDGTPGEPGERSGLLGLAERLAAHGATLSTTTSADEFALEITWGTP